MKLIRLNTLFNLFFIFMIFYLIHHSLNGNYNIQNYLISKFEKRMFEDFNYRLKNEIISVNSDIYALFYGMKDMEDEIMKRQYPFPVDGEVLIKLD